MGHQRAFSVYLNSKWIVMLIWMTSCIHESEQDDAMTKIVAVKDKLLADYDRGVRPTSGTNTTEVYTAFIPRQILELDEERSLFSLDSYFYMHWLDPRLKWNSSEYNAFLPFSKSHLWVPDIFVSQSHSVQVDPFQDVPMEVDPSGSVYWFAPILTKSFCTSASQASYYPEDVVECIVIMGSWEHDGWEINFTHDTRLYMDDFVNIHPRWELLVPAAYIERNVTYYECCPEPYISLHAHFPMKRRPVPEIEATRAPCILVMVLTLSIFWLQPESSKKLLLGGLLFVALNILVCYVAWSTKKPLSVLYGVSYLITAMYIVVVTILLQVFVVIKLASSTGPSQPPAFICHLLTGPLGKYLLLTKSPKVKSRTDRNQFKEDSMASEYITARDEWNMFASALDRLFFLLMLLIMIIVHHL